LICRTQPRPPGARHATQSRSEAEANGDKKAAYGMNEAVQFFSPAMCKMRLLYLCSPASYLISETWIRRYVIRRIIILSAFIENCMKKYVYCCQDDFVSYQNTQQ